MSRRLALGLCLAVAMSLAFAVGASASVISDGGFKYVTKQFTLKPGDPKTTRAECPKRTHVLGGGHWNVGGYSDVIGAHSFPYDSDDHDHQPDDGWAAQLRAFGQSYTATIHAICGKTFPGYEQRQVSVTPDSLSQDFSLK